MNIDDLPLHSMWQIKNGHGLHGRAGGSVAQQQSNTERQLEFYRRVPKNVAIDD